MKKENNNLKKEKEFIYVNLFNETQIENNISNNHNINEMILEDLKHLSAFYEFIDIENEVLKFHYSNLANLLIRWRKTFEIVIKCLNDAEEIMKDKNFYQISEDNFPFLDIEEVSKIRDEIKSYIQMYKELENEPNILLIDKDLIPYMKKWLFKLDKMLFEYNWILELIDIRMKSNWMKTMKLQNYTEKEIELYEKLLNIEKRYHSKKLYYFQDENFINTCNKIINMCIVLQISIQQEIIRGSEDVFLEKFKK